MIRFEPVARPERFPEEVETPGAAWLASNPQAKRPRDLWSPFRAELADGFHSLCAYSAMYEPVGTIDHFVSWNEDRSRAYDWTNYRYAAGWINSSKQSLRSTQIIDPFEVQDGWFEVLLPSLQLAVSATIPEAYRARAEHVLRRLHLRDDERVMRQRRSWMEAYDRGLPLAELERRAPLLARAIRRRDGLA
jgi:hypothetical protein